MAMAWLELEVTPQPAQIAPTRAAVHRFLCAEGVPGTIADDLRLVASELVTNAVTHGPARPVAVTVDIAAPEVVLAVSNRSPRWALPPSPWGFAPPTVPQGRGLGLVAALCDQVEVRGDDHHVEIVCWRAWAEDGS